MDTGLRCEHARAERHTDPEPHRRERARTHTPARESRHRSEEPAWPVSSRRARPP